MSETIQQTPGMLGRVEAEIKTLHCFLEQWLNGTRPASQDLFDTEFADHLAPDFLNIQPAGIQLDRDFILQAIFKGHGTSPEFAIRIRNVEVRRLFENDNMVLAVYEEYQRGALNSKPADNARISTALMLDRGNTQRFRWLHIQETWLTADHHAPQNFEF